MAQPVAGGRVIVVVMGVAGSGKTTIGRLLAEQLGVDYAEGDSFHPARNLATMASGQALDDGDRYPWLNAVAQWIRDRSCAGEGGVVSCSALKYRYRDRLREGDAQVWFLHLDADRDLITRRVAERGDRVMPVSLVNSQFQALEPLRPEEAGATVDASALPGDIVRTAVLGSQAASHRNETNLGAGNKEPDPATAVTPPDDLQAEDKKREPTGPGPDPTGSGVGGKDE